LTLAAPGEGDRHFDDAYAFRKREQLLKGVAVILQALVDLLDVAGLVHGGGDDDVPPRALGRRKCHSAWTGSELG
jgi:hypothetical protein